MITMYNKTDRKKKKIQNEAIQRKEERIIILQNSTAIAAFIIAHKRGGGKNFFSVIESIGSKSSKTTRRKLDIAECRFLQNLEDNLASVEASVQPLYTTQRGRSPSILYTQQSFRAG